MVGAARQHYAAASVAYFLTAAHTTYRCRDKDRRLRLARYLAIRIDRETFREGQQLTIWSNEAMKSAAFGGYSPF
jgi:hypothetical protein